MIVFRLTQERYKTDLSGKGAQLAGGRWNSKGIPLLYTASSRALCVAEVAVHLPLGILPADYWLVELELPETALIEEISVPVLPPDWKNFPHNPETKAFGDTFFLNQKALVLKVPSAVVQGDFNFLINPAHPEFQLLKILSSELFEFDSRLFVR